MAAFLVGVLIGAILTVSSKAVYDFVSKQTSSVKNDL